MLATVIALVFFVFYIWGIERFKKPLDQLWAHLTAVPLKAIYFITGKNLSDKVARVSFLVGFWGYSICIVAPTMEVSLGGGITGVALVAFGYYGWWVCSVFKKVQQQWRDTEESGSIKLQYRDVINYLSSRVYIGTGTVFVNIVNFEFGWMHLGTAVFGAIATTAIYSIEKPKTKKTAPQMVSDFGNKIKATIHTPELIPLPVNGFLTER